MITLDRYLLRRLIASLAKGLVALVFLYVFIDLLTHREAAIAKYNVPWDVVARYYLCFVPKIIYQVAPLAMLVSVLIVLGETAQHNEVTAALASGISLYRFVRAPVLLALVFATGLFVFQQAIGASATAAAWRIEKSYFSLNPDSDRTGMSWADLEGGWTCHIRKFNRIARTGESAFVLAIRDDTIESIEADRIFWDEDRQQWLLEDGRWFRFTGLLSRSASRITQCPAPFTETPDHLFALEKPEDTMTVSELGRAIRYAEQRALPVGRLWADYHAKFSWPALTFVMVGLAIPFAMRLRRGGMAIGFGASIVIGVAYLIVFSSAMGLGHAERISPILAAWLANALFFGAGLVLLWRTPT